MSYIVDFSKNLVAEKCKQQIFPRQLLPEMKLGIFYAMRMKEILSILGEKKGRPACVDLPLTVTLFCTFIYNSLGFALASFNALRFQQANPAG